MRKKPVAEHDIEGAGLIGQGQVIGHFEGTLAAPQVWFETTPANVCTACDRHIEAVAHQERCELAMATTDVEHPGSRVISQHASGGVFLNLQEPLPDGTGEPGGVIVRCGLDICGLRKAAGDL